MKTKQMLQKIVGVILVAVLVLSMAGCGASEVEKQEDTSAETAVKNDDSKTTGGDKAEEPIKLKFLYIWPEYEATMTKTIEDFEAKNPNIDVEVSVVPWDQVRKVIQTRIASDDQPDVAFMWPHAMGPYIDNDQALDLTPYMDAEWEGTFASKSVLIKDVKSDNLYNIPFKGTAPIIFYNKDMYDENGLEFPAYVEDIPAVGEVFKAKGIDMFGLAGKPSGFNNTNILKQLYYADNTYLTGIAATEAWQTGRDFSDAAVKGYADAMNVLYSWYDKGYANTNTLTQTAGEVQTLFANGKVSCIVGNNNELNSLKDLVDFNIGVAVSPTYREINQKLLIGASFDGFFASKDTKHPEAAVALLKHLSSKEVQEMWVKECNATPVVKGVEITDPELSSVAQLFEYFVPVRQAQDYTFDNGAIWAIVAETLVKENATSDDIMEFANAYNNYHKSMAEEYDANK